MEATLSQSGPSTFLCLLVFWLCWQLIRWYPPGLRVGLPFPATDSNGNLLWQHPHGPSRDNTLHPLIPSK